MPQKIRCEVVGLEDHGEQVYSLHLKPETPAPRFSAGQFLHLALDPFEAGDFWPDSRPFSIASPPASRDLLRITYSVKGQFTARMQAELHTGCQVWIKLPYGEFTVDSRSDACLLAGGTGVTAFTAFLSGVGPEYTHSLHIFYGARRPELLIYRSEVEAAAARCLNLKPYFMVEQDPGDGFIPGRINLETVWQYVPEPLSLTYYLSGPPVMLKSISEALRLRRLPPEQIVIDAWE